MAETLITFAVRSATLTLFLTPHPRRCWKNISKDTTVAVYLQVFLFPWVGAASKPRLTGVLIRLKSHHFNKVMKNYYIAAKKSAISYE